MSRIKNRNRVWILVAIFLLSGSACAQDWRTLGLFRIRDMTPFGLTRLDMLPAHAVNAAPGSFAAELNLSYQNTWALSDNVLQYLRARGTVRGPLTSTDIANILALPGDAYLVDGEYGLADLTLHYRFSPHWGAYLTVPFFFFNGGYLDAGIESFHNSFGFGSAGREFTPRNRWQTIAKLRNTTVVLPHAPASDFGDPVLGLRYSFKDIPERWNLIVETAIKLPRGDDELLVSTGKPDFGLQLSLQRFFARNALYASLSTVYYASATRGLADDHWIPTAVAGWETRLSQHVNFVLQVYASRSVLRRTNLAELRADKLQATFGIQSIFRGNVLRFGFTENLANFNNTPDVGLSLSFARIIGAGVAGTAGQENSAP